MVRRKTAAWLLAFCLPAAFVVTAAGENMEPPVLVMFEKVGMSGRQVSFDAPVADIDVRYPFHSASVKSGRWELCTRNNFKGACLDLGVGDEVVSLKKELGFFSRVRSVRPIEDAPSGAGPIEARPAQPETVSAPQVAKGAVEDAPARAAVPDAPAAPVASAEGLLRGHQAYFFKTPMLDGAMIDAEDEDAARAFCAAAGFEKIEFKSDVVSNGRRVVGDLLCAGAP
ncbi:beta/gamma crystallin-related protein [Hyphococcus luteus]|nr:beta/gamma crystallin-related protein [Marinicaulis flavus]